MNCQDSQQTSKEENPEKERVNKVAEKEQRKQEAKKCQILRFQLYPTPSQRACTRLSTKLLNMLTLLLLTL